MEHFCRLLCQTNALLLEINTTGIYSLCLLPLHRTVLSICPFTRVAFRISSVLVEAAMMNGLGEIIRMNELTMRDTELGCS